MFLTVSPADSTWDLKFQLCSLCFLYHRCNEHGTWLTTVLMVREDEYNLVCLFCEGFSGSARLKGIQKSECALCFLNLKKKFFGHCFQHLFVHLGKGLVSEGIGLENTEHKIIE